MDSKSHISDSDLILFQDGELSDSDNATVENHVGTCQECQSRLTRLEKATAAYGEYRERILQSARDTARLEWPRLEDSFSWLDEQTNAKRKRFLLITRTAAGLAFLSIISACLYFFLSPREPRLEDLIRRGEQVPTPARQTLLFTVGGKTWKRSASAHGAGAMTKTERSTEQRVQALFVQANYSWQEPLSVRSYARWRRGLSEKQDSVTTLRDETGVKRFYQLKTATSAGILRTVSLTLKADTIRSVRGAFAFQNYDEVDVAEGEEPTLEKPAERGSRPPRQNVTEAPATPEDELRVFAALNAIGADSSDPVEVSLSSGAARVEVRATGLSRDRENELASALSATPHVHLSFASGQPSASNRREQTDAFAATGDSAYRKVLEARVGGAAQFETVSDRVIDTSNLLLSECHAFTILAREFPPSIEAQLGPGSRTSLDDLRGRHGLALKRHALALEEALKPLLITDALRSLSTETLVAPGTSWQNSASTALVQVQRIDASVGRILAGQFGQEEGDKQLSAIFSSLARVEQFGEAQINSRH